MPNNSSILKPLPFDLKKIVIFKSLNFFFHQPNCLLTPYKPNIIDEKMNLTVKENFISFILLFLFERIIIHFIIVLKDKYNKACHIHTSFNPYNQMSK